MRVEVLTQAEALGFPLWMAPIPSPCPNEVYEEKMREAVVCAVREVSPTRRSATCFSPTSGNTAGASPAAPTPMFPVFGTDADTSGWRAT